MCVREGVLCISVIGCLGLRVRDGGISAGCWDISRVGEGMGSAIVLAFYYPVKWQ